MTSATSTTSHTKKPLVGKKAKQDLRKILSSATDPRKTVSEFQKTHSLHAFLSNAFGTTPVHEFDTASGISDNRMTRGKIYERESKARDGIILETFQPESVLTFLEHLGVTRHDVHKKISDTLRTALEDEVEGVHISPSMGENNRDSLLDLLKKAWQFIHVPDLQPVVIALVKKLGDQTPVEVLIELAKKDDTAGDLKYRELLQQFGINMKQLVWEADWASVVRGDGMPIDGSTSSIDEGSLQSRNILAEDIVKPAVELYINDKALRCGVQLIFPATNREKKVATQSRRALSRDITCGNGKKQISTSAFNTINSSDSGMSHSTNVNSSAQALTNGLDSSATHERIEPCSGIALSKIKKIMGSRPKLLAAILNMLITEHGKNFQRTTDGVMTILQLTDDGSFGYEPNLICTLVADILLSYGQLPRIYEHVSILASVLDNSVKIGLVSNHAIAQIQGCLRAIFHQANDKEKPSAKEVNVVWTPGNKTLPKRLKPPTPSNRHDKSKSGTIELQFKLKLLRKIVEEAVVTMKTSDPQGLFLNAVTDQLAPRYSMVIKNPICIRDIEEKAVGLEYHSLGEYKCDVDLMFKNCIMYNIGIEGKWYRDEAKRQQNIWKSEIWSRAKKFDEHEMIKRKEKLRKAAKISGTVDSTEVLTKENNAKKRKLEIISAQREHLSKLSRNTRKLLSSAINGDEAINKLCADDVDPLLESRAKKRKKDTDFPSMPAIALMLLSDPFVVRLLLDKVLRASRDDIMKTKGVPASHETIPSVLQLIHLSQLSMKVCAMKGKRFMIPSVGISMAEMKDDESGVEEHGLTLPFLTLRKIIPLFTRLLLDLELDHRTSFGGDLYHAKNALPPRPLINVAEWRGFPFSSTRLPLCLFEGAMIHILQPGKSNEASLSIQIPRLVSIINLSSGEKMRNERHFFFSLSHVLLKHKKMPHAIRDLIVSSWLKWFKAPDGMSSMTSAVHECLMHLLMEWASLGNRIMPRDKLLSLAEEVAKAAETSCHDQSGSFAHYWFRDKKAFSAIKSYYERMLKSIPESKAVKWKVSTGIDDRNMENKEG